MKYDTCLMCYLQVFLHEMLGHNSHKEIHDVAWIQNVGDRLAEEGRNASFWLSGVRGGTMASSVVLSPFVWLLALCEGSQSCVGFWANSKTASGNPWGQALSTGLMSSWRATAITFSDFILHSERSSFRWTRLGSSSEIRLRLVCADELSQRVLSALAKQLHFTSTKTSVSVYVVGWQDSVMTPARARPFQLSTGM